MQHWRPLALLALCAPVAAQSSTADQLEHFLRTQFANPSKVEAREFVTRATTAGLIDDAPTRILAKRVLRQLRAKKQLVHPSRRPEHLPDHETLATGGGPAQAQRRELEFNDTTAAADRLGSGAQAIDGTLASIDDVDTFQFVMHTPGTLTATVDPGSSNPVTDPDLLLQSADGSTIAFDDDSGGTLFPRIAIPLGPGIYFLSTRIVSGSPGDYTLSTSIAPSSPDRLVLNQTTSGTISGPEGTAYDLILPVDSRLDISAAGGTSLDLAITIFRPDGSFLFFNDDSTSLDPRIQTSLPAGRYSVLITEFASRTGSFTYRADATPGIPLLPCPGTLSGNISEPGATDLYRVDLTTPQRVTFQTTAGTLEDTVLTLFDRRLLRVTQNDDDGGLTSRVAIDLPAGRWFIAVGGFGSSTGSYQLDGTCSASGASTAARIGRQTLTLQNIGDAATLALEVETPGGFIIRTDTTNGTVADPTLSIVDRFGATTFNDDGGDGLDSRADVYLPPGSYRVVVATFGGEAGDLDLIIEPQLAPNTAGDSLVGPAKAGDLAALFAALFPTPPQRVLPGLSNGYLLLDLGTLTLVESQTVDASGRFSFTAPPAGFTGALQAVTFLGGSFPATFTNRL